MNDPYRTAAPAPPPGPPFDFESLVETVAMCRRVYGRDPVRIEVHPLTLKKIALAGGVLPIAIMGQFGPVEILCSRSAPLDRLMVIPP